MNGNVLDILEESLKLAVEYTQLPDMVEMRLADFAMFREHMRTKFPVLWDYYPSLFEKLVKGDNVDMLFLFIEKLRGVDTGKESLDGVRNDLAQMLHEKYVKTKME